MSTFIEIRPTQHATIKTTGVRIDGNFKVTVRTETGGVATDHKVNFSGLLTDQTIQGSPPIGQVRVGKIGTQERVIIEVLAYHAAGEEDKVPSAGQYWYNIKNHYPFGGTPEQGKTVSPNPSFEGTAQTFPIVIFNESTLTAWTANSATSTVPSRLYGQLGTLANRRDHLKQLILRNVDNPLFPIWISRPLLAPATTADHLLEHGQRQETLIYWLEMLTRAISIDANLGLERQFNFLAGECGLDGGEVITRANSLTGSQIYNGSSSRNGWRYQRLGSVGANTPWTYSPPTGNSWTPQRYDNVANNEISLSTANAIGAGTLDWVTWLRS